MSDRVDVCVVGGGPAGSAAAIRFAGLGYDVALIEAQQHPRPRVGESLTPAIGNILDVLEIRQVLEGALPTEGALVKWGTTVRFHEAPGGYQVDRSRFDERLFRLAGERGASVIEGVRVRSVIEGEDGCEVLLADQRTISAGFVVDAAGKHAVLGRDSIAYQPGTVALYAYWRGAGLAGTASRVESSHSHWLWAAPLPEGRVNAAVFVDTALAQSLSRDDRDAYYLRALSESALLSDCLGGERLTPLQVADATPRYDRLPLTRRTIKIGEACYSVDPLSSQGVQHALVCAHQASCVVNTLLATPEKSAIAAAFYRRRQAEAVATHEDINRRFVDNLLAEAGGSVGAFWQLRGGAPPVRPPCRGPASEDRIRLSADAEVVQSPALGVDCVELVPALRHPSLRSDVAYLDGLPAEQLVAAVTPGICTAELMIRWQSIMRDRQADEVLDWFWQHGLLEPMH